MIHLFCNLVPFFKVCNRFDFLFMFTQGLCDEPMHSSSGHYAAQRDITSVRTTFICECICICICIGICMCICTYICVFLCNRIFLYLYMFTCTARQSIMPRHGVSPLSSPGANMAMPDGFNTSFAISPLSCICSSVV